MTDMQKAARAIAGADALLIGASNGLSIAEGYHIFAHNEMFLQQFGDYWQRFGIRNVLEGCFFHYPDEKDRREFMCRLIDLWVTGYKPSKVIRDLLDIVGTKDYFILTSNADTHLELSGFSPDKVFEVEGTFEDILALRPPKDKNGEVGAFIGNYSGRRLVILELGIGRRNRLIKLPLMQLAAAEPKATYITLNLAHDLYVPSCIADKSIGLAGDIASTLDVLKRHVACCRSQS